MSSPITDERELIVVGERAALGPLRRDLLATYARWVNDPEVKAGVMSLGIYMVEAEEAWYEEAVQASSGMQPAAAHFTIYDRADLRPVGTTALMAIDHRNGRARFGILLGERRSSGLGTEATRLALDWAFTILGLRNVLLEVLPWNTRAIRAYEKAGFRRIGARREAIVSLGERTDEILMDAVASEFTGSVLRPRELGP